MADATKIGVADATKMGVANARVAYLLPPVKALSLGCDLFRNKATLTAKDVCSGRVIREGGEAVKVADVASLINLDGSIL